VAAAQTIVPEPELGDPSISTVPVPVSVTVGDPIHDTATVSGGNQPGEDVTFKLYPPSDPTCAGTPVYTDTDTLVNGSAASGNYTTAAVGTYRWVAEYAGDANNKGDVGECNDEQVTVAAAQTIVPEPELGDPSISTVPVPASSEAGSSIHDTATVTGGNAPTGTVTFQLFGAADSSCEGPAVYTDTVALLQGAATSGDYTPVVGGTYRWIATYNGDDNNTTAISGCDEELVTVTLVLGSVVTKPVVSPAKLPRTGTDVIRMFALGLILMVMGAFVASLPSRRRSDESLEI
jgi:hypothetical protein